MPRRITEQINLFSTDQVILKSGTRLIMENCKKVIYCDPRRVVLLGKQRLEITGSGLRLKELGNGNLEVSGRIVSLLLGAEK